MWGFWGRRAGAVLPQALPLPGRVSLVLVPGANGAAQSRTAPKGAACIILSPSPGTGPKDSHSFRQRPGWPAARNRTVMDCSTYTSSQGGNARSCRAPSAVSSRQGRTAAMPGSGCRFPLSDAEGGRGNPGCHRPAQALLPSLGHLPSF